MVQYARIIDKPQTQVQRISRLEAEIQKAESLSLKATQQNGDIRGAKVLKKAAHSRARMAMRLMGILNIEFDKDVTDGIGRIRKVLEVVRKA